MLAHPALVAAALYQLSIAALWTPPAAAMTHTCDSVFFRAETYADDALLIDVNGDDIKKICDFVIQHDDPLREVPCNAVDTLAQVHVPSHFVVGVFEIGREKICQFSINGARHVTSNKQSASPKTTDVV